mmetsp:Transcript_7258/g.18992  ORF Transcript_7258/g.18992 Transcript_7258/m.18992 type:complete len:341 (-) Transcript_7258:83-1105(-)
MVHKEASGERRERALVHVGEDLLGRLDRAAVCRRVHRVPPVGRLDIQVSSVREKQGDRLVLRLAVRDEPRVIALVLGKVFGLGELVQATFDRQHQRRLAILVLRIDVRPRRIGAAFGVVLAHNLVDAFDHAGLVVARELVQRHLSVLALLDAHVDRRAPLIEEAWLPGLLIGRYPAKHLHRDRLVFALDAVASLEELGLERLVRRLDDGDTLPFAARSALRQSLFLLLGLLRLELLLLLIHLAGHLEHLHDVLIRHVLTSLRALLGGIGVDAEICAQLRKLQNAVTVVINLLPHFVKGISVDRHHAGAVLLELGTGDVLIAVFVEERHHLNHVFHREHRI